jgi:hypothetical protein
MGLHLLNFKKFLGEGRKRRMMERVYLTKIYCKHFCKCHNYPRYKIMIIKKEFLLIKETITRINRQPTQW